MIKQEKSHDTALRIIEVLKILLNEDVDIQTINEKLNSNDDINCVYTSEVFQKYFNTFEELGLHIEKTGNKFSLKNALIQADLSQNEISLLKKIISFIPKLNNPSNELIAKNLISKIDKYVNVDLIAELKNIETNFHDSSLKKILLKTLKKIMSDGIELTISCKKPDGYIDTYKNVTIKKIVEEKEHCYILCYKSTMQRSKRIYLDLISEIQPSPKKSSNLEANTTVVYELYGRLAKSYKIKDWEQVIDFGSDFIRVSNTKEDFETLLQRLLKYGENCKILRPQSVVDDFLKLTDDVLFNLEDISCLE